MKTFFFCIILFFAQSLFAQTYNQWIEHSFDYLEENKLDSAEYALKNAMKLEPASPLNPLLFNNLGTVQRRQGKLRDALVSYTAGLGRAPKNTTLLDARAALFVEMGQAENALVDYTTLLSVEPNNEEALYQRGLLFLKVKNYESAENDFNRLLELNPNTLYGRLGIASLCIFRKDYEDAEKIYYYLLDNLPDNPDVYAGRAELYLLMNKPSKATSDATKAIRLFGEERQNPYVYIIRCKAKLMLHEKAGALEDLNKAISLGYDTADADEIRKLM